ncbi:hypothetical protein SAMN04488066_1134 [Halorubrum aquaticum]|uniref:Cell division protein A N-terminal domain-containing protein n=1 Tax=Halorubrum aquaticum TaxID=387340 RepID=A0A1I3BJ85_9EURY|nr:permease [Halorubrum aquaticum]SFH62365.1 hypothetical protein SAMN04488066_1134 [Halorubrum aquaticum]
MSDPSETNPLFGYYRRYIGDPDRAVDVYAGFGLFFAGLGLGIVGVAVFLYSATLPANTLSTYSVRQVAAVAAALGLPGLLLGVVVLLPVDRRMLYLGSGGAAVCLVAVAWFVRVYPHDWNVAEPPDYSAQVVALYSVGLVAVIGATGAALVAHRVEQASAAGAAGGAGSAAAGGSAGDAGAAGEGGTGGETVTDAEVRADIERELDDAELTWGGVERSKGRRLELNTTAVDDADIDSDALSGSATETRTTSGTVNDAVSQLKGLQGGEKKTASGEGTDDQAAALRELREQQRAEEQAEAEESSVVDRIRGIFE